MLRNALVITLLGIAILLSGTATDVGAEEPSPNGLQKFSNSVNQFGKNLVGLVLPKEEDKKPSARQPQEDQEPYSGRAGSVFNRYRGSQTNTETTPSFPAKPKPERELIRSDESLPDQWPYVDTENQEKQTKTPPAESEIRLFPANSKSVRKTEVSDEPVSDEPALTPATTKPQVPLLKQPQTNTTSSRTFSPAAKTQSTSVTKTHQPLHQRLRVLKESPFESSYEKEASNVQAETSEKTATPVEPIEAKSLEPSETPRESIPSPNANAGPSLKFPATGSEATRNTFAKQNAVHNATSSVTMPTDQVLLRRSSPVLKVQTIGPAKINIGREAKYRVLLENQAAVAAYEVLVTVELPEWADVVGTETEQGTAAIDRSDASRRLCWRLESLPGNVQREMTLSLIPRERRPIELAVRSSFTQVASQAVIEVQEPQLSMRLGGPKQVQLGKPEIFKLEINNSGNGVAEEMVLTLLPLTKSGMPTTHTLGKLEPGGKRIVDLELTAQQLENVSVEAHLKCNGSDGAKLIEKLTVLAPEVKAGIFGPAVRFLGTRGVYQIRLANHGNDDAHNVEVHAVIPSEAKFLKGSEGVVYDKRSNTAIWKLDSLKSNKETILDLECEMVEHGTARLLVNINDGKYTDLSKVATIRVEAMADLNMEVVDPQGPISTGEEAIYEIHIRNRGTRPAETINAVAYFSEGIEPVGASGIQHRISPGQVAFQTINAIPPGETVVLKVRAVAEAPGNHMFRAEMECDSLGTKLIGEETTHFYHGARLAGEGELGENVETADRRNSNEPTLAPQRSESFHR